MMQYLSLFFLGLTTFLLVACSSVKRSVANQYQLSAYSERQVTPKPRPLTVLLTVPGAVAGYQTEQMLYIKKPFTLEAFAKNAWVSPPAEMLYPLMLQSLQHSGFFAAVLSSSYSQRADYRLDSQLIKLEQNFLGAGSFIEFSVNVMLTRIDDNKVLAEKLISQKIPCPSNTPYGGVIAANQAVQRFTVILTDFVVSHLH